MHKNFSRTKEFEMKRVVKIAIALAALVGLGVAPTWAASSAADYGKAWSSGSTLWVSDTKGDSMAVYGEYLRVGADKSAYLYNYSGYKSTVSKNVGSTVTSVRICPDAWGPDNCAAWG